MASRIRNSSGKGKRHGRLRGALWWLMVVSLALLVVLDVAGPYGLWKLHTLKETRDQLYLENVDKAKRNASLEEEMARFSKDKGVQERLVRRELGWVRDGEVLYKFVGRGQ